MRWEPGATWMNDLTARTPVWSPATLHHQMRRVAKSRLGGWRGAWWRRPEQWFAPCRDDVGRRQKLLVVLPCEGHLVLAAPFLGALARRFWIAHRSRP